MVSCLVWSIQCCRKKSCSWLWFQTRIICLYLKPTCVPVFFIVFGSANFKARSVVLKDGGKCGELCEGTDWCGSARFKGHCFYLAQDPDGLHQQEDSVDIGRCVLRTCHCFLCVRTPEDITRKMHERTSFSSGGQHSAGRSRSPDSFPEHSSEEECGAIASGASDEKEKLAFHHESLSEQRWNSSFERSYRTRCTRKEPWIQGEIGSEWCLGDFGKLSCVLVPSGLSKSRRKQWLGRSPPKACVRVRVRSVVRRGCE